jgi:hypothetical protein
MHDMPPDHPLNQLFHGLIEQVFMTEVGICDTRLTEYLSGILADFVHVDAIYRLHSVTGDQICELSRMEAEAFLGPEVVGAARRRLINRYIGDFTLFWTGLYPETLHRSAGHRLSQFVRQGKTSYSIASELTEAGLHPPAELLAQLSGEFETCVHGLNRVRQELHGLRRTPFSN